MLAHIISRHSRLHFLKPLILYSDPPALPPPILHRPIPRNLTFLLEYFSISNDRANNGLETGSRHLSSIPQSWKFSWETDGPDRISGVVDENVGSMAISAVGSGGVDEVSSGDSTEKESLCRETEEKFGSPKTDLNGGEEEETSALLEEPMPVRSDSPKDLEDVKGLPRLRQIENTSLEENEIKSNRSEIEPNKQEEIAQAQLKRAVEKEVAFGRGRRKCSVARVWIQPGDGRFIINYQQFDIYFPDSNHRAHIIQPFVQGKSLGLWDVNCLVRGGGITGQVRALRLGIYRALQNWQLALPLPHSADRSHKGVNER